MQLAFPRKHVSCYKGFWRDIFKSLFFGTDNIKLIERFERQFAEYVGVKHAVAVSSGRWALYLILKAFNLKENDEVILPAITHPSIPCIIKKVGANPVFIDIASNSLNLDSKRLLPKISNRTKVIIATHLFGTACDIENILSIAKGKDINLIEDCATAFGVEVNGKKVGSFGKAAYFSLETTKLVNTLGGGIITTDDYELYAQIKNVIGTYKFPTNFKILRKILFFYIQKFYTNRFFFSTALFPFFRLLDNFNIDLIQFYKQHRKSRINNYNVRFTAFQAMLGLKQLDMIDEAIRKIIENTRFLKEKLNRIGINYIRINPNIKDIQYIFTLLVNDKNIFSKFLLGKKIDCEKNILEICPRLFKCEGNFNNSEEFTKKALQISMNADMNKQDVLYIAKILIAVSQKYGVYKL